MINEAKRLRNVEEYYFSKKLEQISALVKKGISVINLGVGSPDMDAAPEVVETLSRWAKYNGVHGYQGYRGLPEFRKSVCDWYRDNFDIVADYEKEVLPLAGSKEGIMHITQSFVDEGDTVLVPDPGYPAYTNVSRIVGAKIAGYSVSEKAYRPVDLDFIDSVENVKVMWLNFPHMPTGALADRVTLKKLVDIARKKNILIAYDNAYCMIQNPDPISILGIPGAKDVCLELNSLSKSNNMAGWRIGWMTGNKDLINSVLKFRSNMDSGMFLPIQKSAVTALKQGKEWYESLNAEYRERRETVYKMLRFLGCSFHEENTGGMFVWAKIPEGYASGEQFSDELLERTSVFVTPGNVFGPGGEMHIRISLCAEKWQFSEALMRVVDNYGKRLKKRKDKLKDEIYYAQQQ